MKLEKPDWLKLKELHDAELIEVGDPRPGHETRPRSRGCMYGPSESLVDQVGDGLIDVNHLMKRFDKMPTPEQLAAAGIATGGFYENFIGAPDFEEALQIANKGRAAFALLPADEREAFQNNPAEWIKWVTDDNNKDEAIRRGHRKAPEPKKEPEVTLKDVRDAIQEGKGTASKKAGKGEEA